MDNSKIEGATREELITMVNMLIAKLAEPKVAGFKIALRAAAAILILGGITAMGVVGLFIGAVIAWDIPTAKDMLIAALALFFLQAFIVRGFNR